MTQLPLLAGEAAAVYAATPETAVSAVDGVQSAPMFLLKWITANEAGTTGSHQSGYLIPKSAWPLFFPRPGEDGEQFDAFVTIDWAGHEPTESRAIWYGQKTRSEYRLTRFGRDFPFRGEAHVGSLLVLYPFEGHFRAHVLEHDEEIDGFLAGVGLTAADVGEFVVRAATPDQCIADAARAAMAEHDRFPTTEIMSSLARAVAGRCLSTTADDPDRALVTWTRVEYELFRAFEERDFAAALAAGSIDSVERLIELALPFTNRRKARAGRSLEHHFAAGLDHAGIPFTAQAQTEGRNTMDFVFPSEDAYKDDRYPSERLVACGAKTSAKERWRQVLEEADRVPVKHLLTLQPISGRTVQQMIEKGLQPVVPRSSQTQFEKSVRPHLLNVREFVQHVRGVLGT